MDITLELQKIFEKANKNFLKRDKLLLETKVSERSLCGALMLELYEVIKNTQYNNYYVDVEYNRNVNGKVKTFRKTISDLEMQVVTINCDLIIHSRGKLINDNLIALEMKKSTRAKKEKIKDKERLECLTKEPNKDVWSYDGQVHPEHVCGYKLGIYYEIDLKKQKIYIEYYKKGYCFKYYVVEYDF